MRGQYVEAGHVGQRELTGRVHHPFSFAIARYADAKDTRIRNDPLQRYRNLSGKSGVVAYRLLANAIVVEFRNGDRYLYTVESAGPASIERMKALARAGVGLCTSFPGTSKTRTPASSRDGAALRRNPARPRVEACGPPPAAGWGRRSRKPLLEERP